MTAPLSPSYANKLIAAYVKAGARPRTVIDLHAGTIVVECAENDICSEISDWKTRGPDRV